MSCTSGFYFRKIVVPISQAVKSNLFLYADEYYLIYQQRNVEEMEKQLNQYFEIICDWFADNTLSVYSRKDKTKSNLLTS